MASPVCGAEFTEGMTENTSFMVVMVSDNRSNFFGLKYSRTSNKSTPLVVSEWKEPAAIEGEAMNRNKNKKMRPTLVVNEMKVDPVTA